MEKYYYKIENHFGSIIATEECMVNLGVMIGSENCTKCKHCIDSGFDGVIKNGWIKCNVIEKAKGNV